MNERFHFPEPTLDNPLKSLRFKELTAQNTTAITELIVFL